MTVVALDLSSSNTGWALFQPGMERPHFGSFPLRSDVDDLARPMEALRCHLGRWHEAYGLNGGHIVAEKQHLGSVSDKKTKIQRTINPRTVERLHALSAMVEWFAFKVGATYFNIPIQTHRKHFIGRGDYSKDEAKQRAVDKCRELGWHVPDHDAAEACSILDCYLGMIERVDPRAYPRPWRDDLVLRGVRV